MPLWLNVPLMEGDIVGQITYKMKCENVLYPRCILLLLRSMNSVIMLYVHIVGGVWRLTSNCVFSRDSWVKVTHVYINNYSTCTSGVFWIVKVWCGAAKNQHITLYILLLALREHSHLIAQIIWQVLLSQRWETSFSGRLSYFLKWWNTIDRYMMQFSKHNNWSAKYLTSDIFICETIIEPDIWSIKFRHYK